MLKTLYSKTEFVLVRLKKQLAEMHKYSTRPTVLATLASSVMNTLLFLAKFHLFLNPDIITFVNSAVSALTSIPQHSVPLPPPSFTRKLITVILFNTTSLGIK